MGLRAQLRALGVEGIGQPAKHVLTLLALHADDSDPGLACWPSQARLAWAACMSRRTVQRALRSLIAQGYVEAVETRGSTTRYLLHLPAQSVTGVRESHASESHMRQSDTCVTETQGGRQSDAQPASERRPENQESTGNREGDQRAPARESAPGEQQDALDAPVIDLPLSDGSTYHVTEAQVAHWEGLYPGVEVRQALRNMVGWLEANPARRKTRRGVLRFVTNWLSRDQDRGQTQRTPGTANDTRGGQPTGRRAPPEGEASVDRQDGQRNYGGSSHEAIAAFERSIGSGRSGDG